MLPFAIPALGVAEASQKFMVNVFGRPSVSNMMTLSAPGRFFFHSSL